MERQNTNRQRLKNLLSFHQTYQPTVGHERRSAGQVDTPPVLFTKHTQNTDWINFDLWSLQVFARDADSGQNGDIIYSIIGGNKDDVFAMAKPHTGIIVTSSDAAPLDREVQPDGYR